MTPIDATIARRIANRAYYATIEEIARLQQMVIQCRKLDNAFGDRAVPPEKMLRGFPGVMKKGVKYIREIEKRCLASLEENYVLADLLEERFEAEEAASMEAFARDMADRMRTPKTGKRARPPSSR